MEYDALQSGISPLTFGGTFCLLHGSAGYLAYSSTLKMELGLFSETSVNLCRITRDHVLGNTVVLYRCESH
jgi:hypothetical protein